MKKSNQHIGLQLAGMVLWLGLFAGCGPNKALLEKQTRLKAEAAALEEQRDSLPTHEQVKNEEVNSAGIKQEIERVEQNILAAKAKIAEFEAALKVLPPTHRIIRGDGEALEGQATRYADGTLHLTTSPQTTEPVNVAEIDRLEFIDSP